MSTTSKPVHTLVWAKEFYKLLFGNMEESMLHEPEDAEDKSVFMDLVKRPTSFGEEELRSYARGVFTGIYEKEIEKKLGMGLYKTAEHKPEVLVLADVQEETLVAVAEEVGGLAVVTDVTKESEIQTLVERAENEVGPIDIFCSNAGIARLGDVYAPNDEWLLNWNEVEELEEDLDAVDNLVNTGSSSNGAVNTPGQLILLHVWSGLTALFALLRGAPGELWAVRS